MDAKEIIDEMPKGILNWYPFLQGKRILYVVDGENNLQDMLIEKECEVESVHMKDSIKESFFNRHCGYYEYIVAIGVLEKADSPLEVLKVWKKMLMDKGTLLLGMENRLGIRYFCGDQDPFTGSNFDGIENYRRIAASDKKEMEGRLYSQAEIESMLNKAGLCREKWYSVMPGLKVPQLIYSQDCLPTEELSIRYFPMYHNPDTIFLEEEYLCTSLIENGMFHKMANSYLIECKISGEFNDIEQITLSTNRGKEKALATIITKSGKVEKKALRSKARQQLKNIDENAKRLKENGIRVVDGNLEQDIYTMPFIKAEMANVYLKKLIHTNVDEFIDKMDEFRDLILASSTHVEIDHFKKYDIEPKEMGVVLSHAYIDMVPLNCFYEDGEFMFFDQEFCLDNYPANVIITRLVDLLYKGDMEMETILPKQFFLDRYGLLDNIYIWREEAWNFLDELRNEKLLRDFHERYRKNYEIINSNRQRINYSASEYQHLFVDIFQNTDNRKIILFGSGKFTKKFLAMFKEDYSIYAIIDNNKDKWGLDLEGIKIYSPELLSQMDASSYKVIVCVKNYLAIVKQLKEIGVRNYGIYDVNIEYPKKIMEFQNRTNENDSSEPKKYHIGYVAGVFDLFHIGHLNLIKRAKEQCDYLIVGVVTDEGVRKNKKTEPFIPFEERLEMVRSCKYVDEAVEIPYEYSDTKDAYRKYKFDCQFSGSDYVNDPSWQAKKTFLQKQGSDLVFFQYTEKTSSTKIKSMINKKLL